MRGALRTLQVLRALNEHNCTTVLELSRHTGISRAALYRMLETLREAGYVTLDLSGKHYCLTRLVQSLSSGFTPNKWIEEIARPALRALQREILWPVDLGTFMDNAMWICETTRVPSTLPGVRGNAGARAPILRCATGRAYLAWCTNENAERIRQALIAAQEPGFELVRQPALFEAMRAQTRERGYGMRWNEEPIDTGAIAVPIIAHDRIFGCINVSFMRRSITPGELAGQCLEAMRATAASIAVEADRLGKNAAPTRPLQL
ncbi:MAG: transcriptional regulator [Bradyrhizobium sp.]|nr:transcriptional regulator [Bradyrhizobium sp.]